MLAVAVLAVPLWLSTGAGAIADDKQPAGKVQIKTTRITVGLGWEWGGGTLTLNDGSTYNFKIDGLTVIGVGVAGMEAWGEVYNLTNVADFPGNYTVIEGAAAIGAGGGGIGMRNGKGVHIGLRSMQQGVNLQVGPKGMNIKMQ